MPKVMGILVMIPVCQTAHAFKFEMSEVEFQSLSPECKAAYANSNTGIQDGYSGRVAPLEGDLKAVAWQSGAWHYCWGTIRIRRGELALTAQERESHFRRAIGDVTYSFSKIDKNHPWAVNMGVALARAYRGVGETENAKKVLDGLLKFHPNSAAIYAMYAMIYFDEGDYQNAREYLLKGDQASQGQSSEILYFLGLVSVELKDIEAARKYADEAARLGYPLTGLQDKIKALENAAAK